MATVIDTFTGTGALTAHTSDSGATWLNSASSTASVTGGMDLGNRLHITSALSGQVLYYPSVSAATSDQIVQADFSIFNTPPDGTPGILARFTESATPTYYMGRYNTGTSRYEVYKCVAGTLTRIDSNVATQTLTSTYVTVRFEVVGATQKLYLDNVLLISLTDSSITTGTGWGVRLSGIINSNTQNWRLDNLNFTDSVTPPVNSVAPVVSGTRVVGYTLSTTNGTWSGTPTSYTYEWRRDGDAITGPAETASTYVARTGDVGHVVTCAVTGINGSGPSTSPGVSNGLTIVAVMVAGDVQFLKAGAAGLGGAPDSVIATPTDLFDSVTNPEAVTGDIEYRGAYVKSLHAVQTLTSYVQWVASQTSSATTDIAFGFATEAAGADIAAIANEGTAPAGVTFAAPTSSGAGTAGGDIGPLSYRGVWFRWTINSGTAPVAADSCQFGWQGTPA
jgi:hypothetical protein